VEGLGENDETELSIRGPALLEARLLDADTLRGRQARRPLVRLDGQHVRAGLLQLGRCDTGSRSDVEGPNSWASDEAGNEWPWVTRTVSVVLIGSRAERLGPASVGVRG